MARYKLTPHKQGMSWKTPHNDQDTIEGVQKAVGKMLKKGFRYVTIEDTAEVPSDWRPS